MPKAIALSLILHALLGAALVWSRQLDFLFVSQKTKEIKSISAVLMIDKTYKPTDTAMKQGTQKKDLPPPNVEQPKSVDKEKEKENPVIRKNSEKSPTALKKNVRDILKNIREQAKEEKRPPPKEDNFPTHEKGEKKARGTGGRGDRIMTPGEQAMQAAMRKYFELTGAEELRKNHPNAKGFISVKLAAVENQFQIISLSLLQSSGIEFLDQRCEIAIRKALNEETFAHDVLQELNGKETSVTCTP